MKAAFLIVLLHLPTLAQEPGAPGPAIPPQPPMEEYFVPQVRADLLVVRLPEAKAIAFRRDFAKAGRAESPQDELTRLIEAKEAELIDWPVLATMSGNRAVTENIQEHRYPTAFSRPHIVASPFDTHAEPSATPSAPKQKAKPKKEDGPLEKAALALAGVPVNFETRNSGVTLELEAVVGPDGKTIDVNVAPNHVEFLGNREVTVTTEGKHTVVVEQPEFRAQKTSSNIRVKNGEPMLWSFRKLKEPAGQVEVSILTITATSGGKAK